MNMHAIEILKQCMLPQRNFTEYLITLGFYNNIKGLILSQVVSGNCVGRSRRTFYGNKQHLQLCKLSNLSRLSDRHRFGRRGSEATSHGDVSLFTNDFCDWSLSFFSFEQQSSCDIKCEPSEVPRCSGFWSPLPSSQWRPKFERSTFLVTYKSWRPQGLHI